MSTDGAEHDASPTGDTASFLADGKAVGRWVLDPAHSKVEFHEKHFWGLITVHGSFAEVSGEGEVGGDGSISGRISFGASSLGTRNNRRDTHLRSADFFDAARHPEVVLTVTSAKLGDAATLACEGILEAAGHREPVSFGARLGEASERAVTLRAELAVDRSRFGMTWSPLHVSSREPRGVVVARFVRAD